ncbi:serpin family protein, partial [Candidatus Woesearchaeota archaeon]|nr:serpin family protein [Candidatus Woesearchaeota archaeon]
AILFMFPYKPTEPPAADDTNANTQGVQQVVRANNQFAFELYSELVKSHEDNLFFSPYSVSAALAITYEGARSTTADEMRAVLHFPDLAILRPNFAAIYNELNKGNQEYELRTGNALWVQQDFPLLEDYTSTVERYYGAKAANLDFVHETEKSRQTINSFIEEQTNGRIRELIPQGYLDVMTRLVITNAIYFKGNWQWEFNRKETRKMDFKVSPEKTVKVDMMHMKPEKVEFNYADLEDLQILELPYKGEKLSMLILLPKGEFKALEATLTIEKLNEYKSKLQKTKLDGIYIPKFEFNTKYTLNDALQALGMEKAFTPGADFSGMTGKRDLFISAVLHQAFVKVDEKGTEAAAATAVIMKVTAVRIQKIFRADHPFIFIIQDKTNGNILFMGRVVNPNE